MGILVTGGAGFIGSALVRHLICNTAHEVLNLDKLTYAGTLESLASIADNSRYEFVQANIVDQSTVSALRYAIDDGKIERLGSTDIKDLLA